MSLSFLLEDIKTIVIKGKKRGGGKNSEFYGRWTSAMFMYSHIPEKKELN